MRPSFPAVLFALAALMVVGCSPGPLLDRPVSADTAASFGQWQGRTRGQFTAEQWTEFESALQEIKLKLMADAEASGAEAVNAALRAKIHGHTVREVLQQGYTAKNWRMNVERTELEKIMAATGNLVTRPGDTASQRHLDERQRRQAERYERVVNEIRATEARLAELSAPGT